MERNTTAESRARASPSPLPPPPRTVAPLRIIRQPLSKPWRRPAPPPPRVVQVHPRDFRQVVQSLTGAAEPVAEAAMAVPALHRAQTAIFTDGSRENDNGCPAMIGDTVGGDGEEFVWPSPSPANSGWSLSPPSTSGTAEAGENNIFPFYNTEKKIKFPFETPSLGDPSSFFELDSRLPPSVGKKSKGRGSL